MSIDEWQDYIPIGDNTLKVDYSNNNNLLRIKKSDNINLLGVEKENIEEFNESLNDLFEIDLNGDEVINFIKLDTLDKIEIFENKSNNGFLAIRKNNQLYAFYVYQFNGFYEDDKKLTFTGWDYNLVIKIKDISAETIYTR